MDRLTLLYPTADMDHQDMEIITHMGNAPTTITETVRAMATDKIKERKQGVIPKKKAKEKSIQTITVAITQKIRRHIIRINLNNLIIPYSFSRHSLRPYQPCNNWHHQECILLH